jgi:hypothetical protein
LLFELDDFHLEPFVLAAKELLKMIIDGSDPTVARYGKCEDEGIKSWFDDKEISDDMIIQYEECLIVSSSELTELIDLSNKLSHHPVIEDFSSHPTRGIPR